MDQEDDHQDISIENNTTKKSENRFTSEERVRLVQLYAEYQAARKVQKIWTRENPDKKPPSANTILRLYQKFSETGSVANRKRIRPRTSRTEENIEKVKKLFQKFPSKSIRQVSKELNIPHTTVGRILSELKGKEGGQIKRARCMKLGSKALIKPEPVEIKTERDPNIEENQAQQIIMGEPFQTEQGTTTTLNYIITVPNLSLSEIFRTLTFAAEKHSKQRRKDPDQTPYINHLIGVTDILVREGLIEDIEILQAAILHDVVEDTETSLEELDQSFGTKITGIVNELSDDKTKTKEERKSLQIENAPKKTYEAKLVGMADKIYNLRDLNRVTPVGWSQERVTEYFEWAKAVVTHYYDANSSLASILEELFIIKENELLGL